MTAWLLILYITADSLSITAIDVQSKFECEKVYREIIKKTGYADIKYSCLKRGE